MLSRHRAVLALTAYLLLLGVHLAAQAAGAEAWTRPTQVLLAPVLAVVLLVAPVPASRLTRLVLLGLVLSWLGDWLPAVVGEDAAFVAMVGAFALAQASYAAAFWPLRADSVTGTGWPVAYGLAAAALVLVCAPGADGLLAAVVGYAVVITVMAVLATGVHPLAAVGGVVFMASDALIALEAFVPDWDLPAQSFWVMATYGVAQLMLVLGVLARARAMASTERRAGAIALPS